MNRQNSPPDHLSVDYETSGSESTDRGTLSSIESSNCCTCSDLNAVFQPEDQRAVRRIFSRPVDWDGLRKALGIDMDIGSLTFEVDGEDNFDINHLTITLGIIPPGTTLRKTADDTGALE